MQTIETRSFQELWSKGIIDHDQFREKSRAKNLSDSTLRNWTSGARRPSATGIIVMMDILRQLGIKGKPEDLFPRK